MKNATVKDAEGGLSGMENDSISVLLADDHARVRAGIRFLLDRVNDIIVVGEASNGSEALDLVKELSPDILLLDIEMPKLNGMQVAKQIQNQDLPVQILVLSAYDDTEYINGMLESGVAGYLTKDEVPTLLYQAIRGVARGEFGWVSQRVSARIKHLRPLQAGEQMTLTARELAVLRLLAGKKTPEEIAVMLEVEEDTVSQQIDTLRKKFKAKSPVDLVVLAQQAKLI